LTKIIYYAIVLAVTKNSPLKNNKAGASFEESNCPISSIAHAIISWQSVIIKRLGGFFSREIPPTAVFLDTMFFEILNHF
jgi:hypothetical protein